MNKPMTQPSNDAIVANQSQIYDNKLNADYVNKYLHKNSNKKRKLKHANLDLWNDGLFLLVKSEYHRVLWLILTFSILTLTAITWGLCNQFWLKLPVEINIFPLILGLIGVYHLVLLLFEFKFLKKDIIIHNNNARYEKASKSEEGLISKVYLNTQLNQIKHNWWLLFTTTYISLFVLLIWGLRDKSWYFLKFSTWLVNWFGNPNLLLKILVLSLVINFAFYILALTVRKRRMQHIEMYFGHEYVIDPEELDKISNRHHRFYVKTYILTLFLILIIPILISVYILLHSHGKKVLKLVK